MKKIEAWMDSMVFNLDLGNRNCKITASEEACEAEYPCIKESQGLNLKHPCEAKRVYIFDADEYDKQDPSSKEALPLILALLKDPEFCKATLDKVEVDAGSIAGNIFEGFKKEVQGDMSTLSETVKKFEENKRQEQINNEIQLIKVRLLDEGLHRLVEATKDISELGLHVKVDEFLHTVIIKAQVNIAAPRGGTLKWQYSDIVDD